MFWFALGCTASGLVLGWVVQSTIVLSITSLQIVAILCGVWMGGLLGGWDLLIWSVTGMFLHQGAYLGSVIARALRDERAGVAPSIADQVDQDLVEMHGLVKRIATAAPTEQVQVDTEQLTDLIKQMRRTLRDDEALERIRKDRRRAAG